MISPWFMSGGICSIWCGWKDIIVCGANEGMKTPRKREMMRQAGAETVQWSFRHPEISVSDARIPIELSYLLRHFKNILHEQYNTS